LHLLQILQTAEKSIYLPGQAIALPLHRNLVTFFSTQTLLRHNVCKTQAISTEEKTFI